jgi:hypothetical protein
MEKDLEYHLEGLKIREITQDTMGIKASYIELVQLNSKGEMLERRINSVYC